MKIGGKLILTLKWWIILIILVQFFNYTLSFKVNEETLAGKDLKAPTVLFHNLKKSIQLSTQPSVNSLIHLLAPFWAMLVRFGDLENVMQSNVYTFSFAKDYYVLKIHAQHCGLWRARKTSPVYEKIYPYYKILV